MATRSRKKTSTTTVRHTVPRRKQQVQGLDNETVQIIKAALTDIQKTLDFNRDTSSKRPGGSLWADLYTRSGTFLGTLHYPLSEQFLSKVGVQHVRVESPTGGFLRSGGEDKSADFAAVGRRLSRNAGTDFSYTSSEAPGAGVPEVPRRRGTVHNGNGRGEYRSSKRSSRGRKVSSDS